jgi:hypothetical protein
MAHLNFSGNHAQRAKIFPQAVVKLNARSDTIEYAMRAENGPSECYFDGSALKGALTNHNSLEYDGEIAYIMREPAMVGEHGRYNTNRTRDFTSMRPSVPGLTSLAGIPKMTPKEIEEITQPLGHVEQGNQDNGSTEWNIMCGGQHTIIYNGLNSASINSPCRLFVPTHAQWEEAKKYFPAEMQGRSGRVVYMMEEFDIHKLETFDPVQVHSILKSLQGDPDETKFTLRQHLFKRLVKNYCLTAGFLGPEGIQKYSESSNKRKLAEELEGYALSRYDEVLNHLVQVYEDYLRGVTGNQYVRAAEQLFRELLLFKNEETRFILFKFSYGAMPRTDTEIQYFVYAF